jgi:hypothetical protein
MIQTTILDNGNTFRIDISLIAEEYEWILYLNCNELARGVRLSLKNALISATDEMMDHIS